MADRFFLVFISLSVLSTICQGSVMFQTVPSAKLLLPGDDIVEHYYVQNPIPLYKSTIEFLYVSTNGYISFQSFLPTRNWDWPYVKRFNQNVVGLYSIDLWNLDASTSNITYAEVNTTTPGHESLFETINSEISKRRLNFTTKYAIVVSYNNVQMYQDKFRLERHSFQGVFASDGIDTYGIFNYDKTPKLETGGSLFLARTGIYEPNNKCADRQSMHQPTTLSHQLSELSNVGVPGRYVYSLTRCLFQDHCQPSPCLNEGDCENYEDGHVCRCSNGYSGVNCEIAPVKVSSVYSSIKPSIIPSQSIEHSITPSQSMEHSITSSQSMEQSMRPSQSIEQSMRPSQSMEQSMRPSQSMEQSMRPSQSMEQSMRPSQSIEQSMRPSQSMEQSMRPSQSIEQSMRPSQSMEQSMMPSQSMENSMMSSQSMEQSIRPSQSMEQSKGPSQSMVQSMRPSQSIEQSMRPSQSMEQSMRPSQSLEQSMRPSQSMEQSMRPSQSMEQSMRPSKSMEQSIKPSQSMEQSMRPSQSMEQSMRPSQSMEQSMRPSQSIEQSMRPSQSIEQSMRPSQSMEQSMRPSQSIEQSMRPSQSMEQSIKPSQSMEQSMKPSQSIEQSMRPSQSMEQSMRPSQSMEKSMRPSQSIEQSMRPSQSIEQSMRPSQSIEQSISPSQSMEQSMRPSQSMEQSMRPSQSIEQSMRPSQSMEQSMRPSQSIEQSMRPSQSMEQSMRPSQSMEQSMRPSQSIEQSMRPSQSMEQSMRPSQSMEQSIRPSQSIEQSMRPSQSMEQSMRPSQSMEQSMRPSQSMEQSMMPSQSMENSMMSSQSMRPTQSMEQSITFTQSHSTSQIKSSIHPSSSYSVMVTSSIPVLPPSPVEFQPYGVSSGDVLYSENNTDLEVTGLGMFSGLYQIHLNGIKSPFGLVYTIFGQNATSGNIYYREETEVERLRSVNSGIELWKATQENKTVKSVRRSQESAHNNSAVIVTYEDISQSNGQMATFQMTLAADKTNLYVLFNFKRMGAYVFTIFVGNLTTCGLQPPVSLFANSNVTSTSNIGYPGRHVFQIDCPLVSTNPTTTPPPYTTPNPPLPSQAEFFPFGLGTNDKPLTVPTHMVTPDDVFVKKNTDLFIHPDGFIAFAATEETPLKIPNDNSILSPYYHTNMTAVEVFYRETTNQTLLTQMDEEVSKLQNPMFQGPFTATYALIVTYNKLQQSDFPNLESSFQTVIVSDSNHTFAITTYKNLEYNGLAAFYGSKCNHQVFSQYEESKSLANTSNVGTRGRHVHYLSGVRQGCSQESVLYPFGEDKGDVQVGGQVPINFYHLSVQDWNLFTYQRNDIFINSNGAIHIDMPGIIGTSKELTYVAPYYHDRSHYHQIYYRQEFNQSLLSRISQDVQRRFAGNTDKDLSEFKANKAVIVTFLVQKEENGAMDKFQIALATNGVNTVAVNNYEFLTTDASYLGYSEANCTLPTEFSPAHKSSQLAYTSNSGKMGQHVFALTNHKCLQKIVGLKSMKLKVKSITFLKVQLYGIPVEIADSTDVIHGMFIDVVTRAEKPIQSYTAGSKGLGVAAYRHNAILTYIGYDNGTLDQSLLLVMKHTNRTRQLQYGEEKFPMISSDQYCNNVIFESEMQHRPSIKIQAHVYPLDLTYPAQLVNVWLHNVTSHGFTYCVQELVAFIGQRDGSVGYIAAAGDVDGVTEQHVIDKKAGMEVCQSKMLNHLYLTEPSVFVSAEIPTFTATNYQGPLVAWVKNVSSSHFEVCVKSSMVNAKDLPLFIHVIVKGDIDPCVNYTCPDHLQCRVDSMKQAFCGCIKECHEEPICGTDGQSHDSMCHVHKEQCEKYGANTKSNITVAYQGKCFRKPMESGMTQLEPIERMAGVFCKYVNLTEFVFEPIDAKLHVFLTVSWGKTRKPEDTRMLNDASASWSEDVTTRGFKACVLVAGRHMAEDFTSNPSVYWTVFQKNLQYVHGEERLGVKHFGSWYTGSRCELVSEFTGDMSNDDSLFLMTSVEHTSRQNYQNAMTVWTEKRANGKGTSFHVCARELQNFDGMHDGIKVHYFIGTQADMMNLKPMVSEHKEIMFEGKKLPMGSNMPPMCKTIYYNFEYPTLPRPTILTSIHTKTAPAINDNNSTSQVVTFSDNDAVSWIEHVDNHSMTVCLKSLRLSTSEIEEYAVSVIISPNYCEPGSNYFEGACYKHTGADQATFSEASLMCGGMHHGSGYGILTIENDRESAYIENRVMSSAWLNLQRNQTSGSNAWRWLSGSNSTFRNWLGGHPLNQASNAIVVSRTGSNGWESVSSDSNHSVICRKELDMAQTSCEYLCLNGGVCKNPGPMQMCECSNGFLGKRCEKRISDIAECVNYMNHANQTWRSVNNTDMVGDQNKSCDARDMRDGWHRFSGQLYDQCTNQTNVCGTPFPGWVGGYHPDALGERVTRDLHFYSSYCASDQGQVEIQNCGAFFTYKFTRLPYWSCDYGVCTTM